MRPVCVCVCFYAHVQMIWRQVYEAHDLCMSVWTVSASTPSSHVGVCTQCGHMESKDRHHCTSVSPHRFGWSFQLVGRMSTSQQHTNPPRHIKTVTAIIPFEAKFTIWFTFIFLGYHAKEVPCHHCKCCNCICCPQEFYIKMQILICLDYEFISLIFCFAEKCPDTRYVNI